MSRFTVAMDLSSWHRGQRENRRQRRKAGRGKGGGGPRRGGARAEARGGTDLEAAVPLGSPKRGKSRPGRRGRDAVRGEEDGELHEAELADSELEANLDADLGDEDLGVDQGHERRLDRKDRGERPSVKDRVRDAVTRDWQKPMDLGANMRIQTRKGFRAALIEVKPGLFVVAEVPAESVEFGFGPMLLAPALIKTLGRALQGRRSAGRAGRAHRPELSTEPAPKQLQGPVQDPETEGLARWLDDDIAAELGCPVCLPKDRRQP